MRSSQRSAQAKCAGSVCNCKPGAYAKCAIYVREPSVRAKCALAASMLHGWMAMLSLQWSVQANCAS
eukprot:5531767-Alexandrium_andersonii.AAC.1